MKARWIAISCAAAIIVAAASYAIGQVNTGAGVQWPPIFYAQRLTWAQVPAAAASTGMVVVISDSNSVTWGANITGSSGSSTPALAWSNGSNWTVIGK